MNSNGQNENDKERIGKRKRHWCQCEQQISFSLNIEHCEHIESSRWNEWFLARILRNCSCLYGTVFLLKTFLICVPWTSFHIFTFLFRSFKWCYDTFHINFVRCLLVRCLSTLRSFSLIATVANVLAFFLLLCWLQFIFYASILMRTRAPNAISSIRMAISHQLWGHNNKKKMRLWLLVFAILLIHKWMSISVMRFHFLRFHMLELPPPLPLLWIRFLNLWQTGNRRNTPRNSQIQELHWNGTWQTPWKEEKNDFNVDSSRVVHI